MTLVGHCPTSTIPLDPDRNQAGLAIPSTRFPAVRAATIRDGELRVEQHPDPQPGKGEILVRVRAAGLNGADMLQRRGAYPAPPGWPKDIPGLELAGEVAERGPAAERFAEGDRVMAVVGGGGQAELAVLHEREAMPVPATLEWPEAGALPEVFITAHDALFTQCGLRSGERLLVHGGAGGVGTAGIQLARAAGASVTATVRREELRPAVERLGARAIAPDGFEERGPFDVVLELVGGPNLGGNVKALASGGRIVVIGIGAGATAQINLAALMAKRGVFRASTLRARPLEEKAQASRAVEREVLPLIEERVVRVPVQETFSLDEVAEAYERFSAGGKLGKIVLVT
jgi:NADPH:quinone reductase